MGEAADRKVTEIEATRRQLEADLKELEARVPAQLRSVKSLAGIVLGGSGPGARTTDAPRRWWCASSARTSERRRGRHIPASNKPITLPSLSLK